LLQGRAQLEELIGKLVDLLVRSGEMAALGTGVRNVKGNAAGELALHVEIPLLRISGGIVRKGRREALTEEKLLETRSVVRRLNNSGRERIAQAVERRDRTVIGSDEGCGVRVNRIVIRADVERNIVGDPEDAVPGADDGLVIDPISQAEAGSRKI